MPATKRPHKPRKTKPAATSRAEVIGTSWSGIKWRVSDPVNDPRAVIDDNHNQVAIATRVDHADLIAMAPSDIQYLLRRCRRLEKELLDLRQLKIWKEEQRHDDE